MSNTVTVKVHVLLLPLLSRAVLVTMVVPTGKANPLAGTLVTLATPQLSMAVTANVALLVHMPGAVLTVRFAGHVSCGGCVSLTVTVKMHVLLLPVLSRTVLVTIVVPRGNANPLAGTLEMLVTAQLSDVLTVKVTLLVQTLGAASTVMLTGQVICGGCVSLTVTVKVHVLLLPLLSRAVLVTVVVPRGKANPLAGALEMLVTAQLSVAVTMKVTLLEQAPGGAFTVRFAGQVITGGWVSFTMTVKEQVLLLPLLSRAVLVTMVLPSGKAKPLAGLLETLVTAQLSVAVTLNVTMLVHAPGAVFPVRFAGQVMAGGCVSFTVTVKVQVLELPRVSRAVLVTVVVPRGKAKPLAGILERFVTVQLSLAATTKVTLLVQTPGAVLTVRFAGQATTGS